MLPGASGKWRNCSSAPPGRHARMLSPVTATRRAPGDRASTKAAPIAARFLKGTVRCSPCAVCTFAQTRLPFWRGIAPSKSDQHDHDRAGVPRRRASMPVLGRVGERSGKQRSFLRPRRDLGERGRSDREIDRRAGDQHNRRTFAPSGGLGLTVPDGPPAVRSCGRLAMLAAIRAPRP